MHSKSNGQYVQPGSYKSYDLIQIKPTLKLQMSVINEIIYFIVYSLKHVTLINQMLYSNFSVGFKIFELEDGVTKP